MRLMGLANRDYTGSPRRERSPAATATDPELAAARRRFSRRRRVRWTFTAFAAFFVAFALVMALLLAMRAAKAL
jgi:hypothetical protein